MPQLPNKGRKFTISTEDAFVTPKELAEALVMVAKSIKSLKENTKGETTQEVERIENRLNNLSEQIKRMIDSSEKRTAKDVQTLGETIKSISKDLEKNFNTKLASIILPDVSPFLTRTEYQNDRKNVVEEAVASIKIPVVTPISIRYDLETLTEDERLDKSAIKGLEEYDEKLIKLGERITLIPSGGGGSGGVSVFQNGTRVGSGASLNFIGATVTNTDGHTSNITITGGGGGSQDLQQVTDEGNTTTNDIIAGAILAGGPTSPGTTNPFLQVYDGSNGVYGGFYFGDDDSFGVSYNTDTTPEGLLTYSGRYASLVFLGTASGAFSGSFSAVNTNPNGQTLDFPTASGTLALSVNGNTADSAGNITISAGSPAGSDTYVQYNDGGVFGGDSNFVWNKTQKRLSVFDATFGYGLDINAGSGEYLLGNTDNGIFFNSATGGSSQTYVGGNQYTSIDASIFTIGDISGLTSGATFSIDQATPSYIFNSGNFSIDSVSYTFPSALGSANSVLTDAAGDGVLSWATVGGGSPGGSTTQLQYNNAGAFGGISGATTNGTSVTYTTGNLLTPDVKASSSAGIQMLSNSGSVVSLFGAGGGTGATFYGGVALDTMTLGSVLFAGSSGLISQDNANFFWDDTNNRLGLGTASPASFLHINRNDIRVTQSDAYGITLQNATASIVTSGQDVQYSPAVVFRGTEWLTTTGASHTLDYRMFARPVSGTTAARGGFIIQQSLNGAAYTDMFEVGQTISNSAGYNIRLNNATVFALGGGVVQFYGSSSGMGFYNSTGSVQFAALDANGRWALTPTSLTTAATINTWNLAQTWNNASGDYTAHRIAITNTNSASTSRIVNYLVGGTSMFSVDVAGKTYQDTTITAGGTTGNQTINKPTGTVNIAAAGTTVTVTNSLCTTSSIVFAVIRTNDTTATIKNVVPGAGSFVINLGAAATAEVSIGFKVIN